MATLQVDGAPGGPMHHELLSPVARALALLQHPPRHTCSHTLALRRCAFRAHRRDLKLPLMFRVQVGCEATDPLLGGDNAISVLKIRPGDACFAVLEALSPALRPCLPAAGGPDVASRVLDALRAVVASIGAETHVMTRARGATVFSEKKVDGKVLARACRAVVEHAVTYDAAYAGKLTA